MHLTREELEWYLEIRDSNEEEKSFFETLLQKINGNILLTLTLVMCDYEIVGEICFREPANDGGVEICVARVGNGGSMSDAIREVCDAVDGVTYVYARIAEENVASQKMVDRAGFVQMSKDRWEKSFL